MGWPDPTKLNVEPWVCLNHDILIYLTLRKKRGKLLWLQVLHHSNEGQIKAIKAFFPTIVMPHSTLLSYWPVCVAGLICRGGVAHFQLVTMVKPGLSEPLFFINALSAQMLCGSPPWDIFWILVQINNIAYIISSPMHLFTPVIAFVTHLVVSLSSFLASG